MWEEELDLAKEACLISGKYLVDNKKSASKVISSIDKDIKLEADYRSEELIIKHLQKFSSYPILSEENYKNVQIDLNSESPAWIVDPLDGSLNYSRGIPLSCISIALWKSRQPLLGVVFDFNRGEMFSRSKNEKLYLNDTPINFNIKKKLKQESVIATGFPSGGSYDEKSLMNFVYKVQDYKKVRLLGSAALSLAWVSINRIDSYSEKGIYLWDVAAGLALNNCFDSNLVIENYICNITI